MLHLKYLSKRSILKIRIVLRGENSDCNLLILNPLKIGSVVL